MTYFVGNFYEVTGTTITKYYFAGSQRIAMRVGNSLYYLLTDHLGSTSLVLNATGVVVSEMRYSAWGEVRYSSGSSPTKYQYTGQFSYAAEFGLLFYNARWYDGRLARFISADTILPGIENPQAWDRYSYGLNNPSRYTDPTGHMIDVGEGGSSLSTSLQQFLIYKKSIVLYKQTQKEVGGIDDLEAFAQLTEYAASLTLDCTACFVDNMGAVVTGYTGNHPGTMVILNRLNQDRFPLNRYYRALKDTHQELGQTGFAPIFRDNAGKANQSRHYWEYVQSGYFENWNYATAGNVFHETIDPSSDRNEKSYHDFVLGVEGADLGFLLHIGAVSPEGAGQYIRDNLSKDSFSAMFWSNPFGPWGPPPLWMPDQ